MLTYFELEVSKKMVSFRIYRSLEAAYLLGMFQDDFELVFRFDESAALYN